MKLETLQSLVSRQFDRLFALGAALAVIGLGFYSASSIRQISQEAQTLIMNQAVSLTRSAMTTSELYLVQKELSRFVQNLDETQSYTTRIEVRVDHQLIGAAGKPPAFELLSSSLMSGETLQSGRYYEVLVFLDHSRGIAIRFAQLAALLLVMGALYAIARLRILRSLKQATDPLSALVGKIETLSSQLPDSLSEARFDSPSTTQEVAALQGSIQKFVGEIVTLQDALARSAADRARFEIASQVAHDIRSPLAALKVVLSDLSQLPEDSRDLIRGAANRIQDIANSLLEQNRAPRAEAAPVPLAELIEELVLEKRAQFKTKPGISIEARANSRRALPKMDPTELTRVLSNLINNAVEAMDESGNIRVELEDAGEGVEIRIKDNGRGIPSEVLPRLMQRGETYGKREGTGLGLYHARTAVENRGGKIRLDSEPGRGTQVTLTFH